MKPRLYMETTIPSVLTARPSKLIKARAQQEDTKLWWAQMADRYQIFVSEVVHFEAAEGEKAKAFERLAIVESFPFLPITDAVIELGDAIEKLGVIPAACANDAVHLAMAAVHKMDILLTWNMKHICNGYLFQRFSTVCQLSGHQMPMIVTPSQLLEMP